MKRVFPSLQVIILSVCVLFLGGKLGYASSPKSEGYLLTRPDTVFLPDTLNFGPVIIHDVKKLGFSLKNVGTDTVIITNFNLSDAAEFSLQGPTNYLLAPDSTVSFFASFSPQSHSANGQHQSNVVFHFQDLNGTLFTEPTLLTGQDHVPVTAHLSISQNYLSYADSTVVISQFVTDSLVGTLSSIKYFNENISYNKDLLELIDVQNGAQMPQPAWTVRKAVTTQGVVQVTATSTTPLVGPGELIKLIFHVLSTSRIFDTSEFVVDPAVVLGNPFEPIMMPDTGMLRIIDACVPIVATGVVPRNPVMQVASNPVVQRASISYFISENSTQSIPVRFKLYNASGNLTRSIDNAETTPGWHELPLDVSNLSSGVYTLEFQAGATDLVQRLLVLH